MHSRVLEFTTMQFGKRDVPNVTNALCFKKLSILFLSKFTVTVMHACDSMPKLACVGGAGASLLKGGLGGHSLRSSCVRSFGALHLWSFFVVAQ